MQAIKHFEHDFSGILQQITYNRQLECNFQFIAKLAKFQESVSSNTTGACYFCC